MNTRGHGHDYDEESLTGQSVNTTSSQQVLVSNSRQLRVKKIAVTISMFVLVGLVIASVGYGLIKLQNHKEEGYDNSNQMEEDTFVDELSNGQVAQLQALTSSRDQTLVRSTPTNTNPIPIASEISSASNEDNQGNQKVSVRISRQVNRTLTKTLPTDASLKHPVSLLHEMNLNPVTEFTNCPKIHPFFKAIVTVGRESFEGYGKKKRDAKKMAAQHACVVLFRLSYLDHPTQSSMQTLKEKCGV